jgi:hypothetical protein
MPLWDKHHGELLSFELHMLCCRHSLSGQRGGNTWSPVFGCFFGLLTQLWSSFISDNPNLPLQITLLISKHTRTRYSCTFDLSEDNCRFKAEAETRAEGLSANMFDSAEHNQM